MTVSNEGDAPAVVDLRPRGYLDEGSLSSQAAESVPLPEQARSGLPFTVSGSQEQPPTAAAPPWESVAPLRWRTMDATAVAIGGLVYSVGGTGGGGLGSTNEVFAYEPAANAWTQKANMHRVRQRPAAAASDGQLYVSGGWRYYPDGGGEMLAEGLEVYDPASNTWTLRPGPPRGLVEAWWVCVVDWWSARRGGGRSRLWWSVKTEHVGSPRSTCPTADIDPARHHPVARCPDDDATWVGGVGYLSGNKW